MNSRRVAELHRELAALHQELAEALEEEEPKPVERPARRPRGAIVNPPPTPPTEIDRERARRALRRAGLVGNRP